MPLAISAPDLPPSIPKAPSRIAVLVVWAFVTLALIVMTGVGQSLKAGKFDLIERVIWEIGWLGWVPLTSLVLAICRAHPIDRQHRLSSVARLAVYGLGVVVLQVAFDFACNLTLGSLLRNNPFSWQHLLFIVVFKAHIYYGVYWMIVGAAHAYEFHARYLKGQLLSSQLEAKLAHAELDRLKTQLQPHFLFNTHHTIVSLVLKQENDAAVRMLTRLSDLLRVSLARSGQQVVTLREELETLRLYLDIQRERFRDRLTVEIFAPEEWHEAEVPHLLLQPVVENALLHGLEDVTENARLEIRVRRESAQLVCEVRDNGAGFLPDKGTTARADHGDHGAGIGLTNTRERLQQLYGREQTLGIRSTPGEGCTVTIRIPFCLRPTPAAFVTA